MNNNLISECGRHRFRNKNNLNKMNNYNKKKTKIIKMQDSCSQNYLIKILHREPQREKQLIKIGTKLSQLKQNQSLYQSITIKILINWHHSKSTLSNTFRIKISKKEIAVAVNKVLKIAELRKYQTS